MVNERSKEKLLGLDSDFHSPFIIYHSPLKIGDFTVWLVKI